jgi:hypothetical protein
MEGAVTEPPSSHEADHGLQRPPGVPFWVKGLGIAIVVLVVVVVVAMALIGGEHGPGRH